MTPESQRIAIAEACGWEKVDGNPAKHTRDRWIDPKYAGRYAKDYAVLERNLPDYLNDLNIMHEAEKVLKDYNFGATTERATYINKLETVVFLEAGKQGWSWALTHATAAQRAEAFLKTLKLWKDS